MKNVSIVLRGDRPVSWNRYYSGTHWRTRASLATNVHLMVRAALSYPEQDVFEKPVHITVRAYLKGQRIDADNICAKMYIDGLKGIVIKDDDPRYVTSVTTVSLKDKEDPRVEIHVSESPGVVAGACVVYSVDVR